MQKFCVALSVVCLQHIILHFLFIAQFMINISKRSGGKQIFLTVEEFLCHATAMYYKSGGDGAEVAIIEQS